MSASLGEFSSIKEGPPLIVQSNYNYGTQSYNGADKASLKTFLLHPDIKRNILDYKGNSYFLDDTNNHIIVIPNGVYENVHCIKVKGVSANINLAQCAHIYFAALPTLTNNISDFHSGKNEEEKPFFNRFTVDIKSGAITGGCWNFNRTMAFNVEPVFRMELHKILKPDASKLIHYTFDKAEIDPNERSPFHTWRMDDPAVVIKPATWKFWAHTTYNKDNISQNGFWTLRFLWKNTFDTVSSLKKESKIDLSNEMYADYCNLESRFKYSQKLLSNLQSGILRGGELNELNDLNESLLVHWKSVETSEHVESIINHHVQLQCFFNSCHLSDIPFHNDENLQWNEDLVEEIK